VAAAEFLDQSTGVVAGRRSAKGSRQDGHGPSFSLSGYIAWGSIASDENHTSAASRSGPVAGSAVPAAVKPQATATNVANHPPHAWRQILPEKRRVSRVGTVAAALPPCQTG